MQMALFVILGKKENDKKEHMNADCNWNFNFWDSHFWNIDPGSALAQSHNIAWHGILWETPHPERVRMGWRGHLWPLGYLIILFSCSRYNYTCYGKSRQYKTILMSYTVFVCNEYKWIVWKLFAKYTTKENSIRNLSKNKWVNIWCNWTYRVVI